MGNVKRGWLAVLAAQILLGSTVSAQVKSTITGPGVRRLPIAVSPLKNVAGAAGRSGEQFADLLIRDLELSGLFRVLPRDTYIDKPETSGVEVETINFDNWGVLGALALVKGTVQLTGSDIFIEARLFDIAEQRQLSGRRFRGVAADLDRMAHRFADEVIKQLTGERGPFDSRIAFLSTRGGRFKDLYVMSVEGAEIERLTENNTLNLSPSWGPRADHLLLTSYRHGDPDLYGVGYPGGRFKRLASIRGLNLGAVRSPNGRVIATTLEFAGNSEIAILDSDGALQKRLTNHWAIDVSPSWSPDGEHLAFCSSRSGGPQIYVMTADGSSVRRVTGLGSYNTSPRWSPRGDRIAYVSRVSGVFQIFTVGVDGSDVQQVTGGPGSHEDPSWSPDGRYLVFSRRNDGANHLYLSDLSGTNVFQLTGGKGNDTSPAWSGWLAW
jgi:TolB protein